MFRRLTPFVLVLALVAVLPLRAQTAAKKDTAASKKAAPAAGDLQAVLEKRERVGWEAYKNKDTKAFTELATPDYTAVLADGNGERDLQGTLDSTKQITINSYSLTDFHLTHVASDAALLRYKAAVNLTIGNSEPQDFKIAVSDLWVKRGGVWKSLHYQETETK